MEFVYPVDSFGADCGETTVNASLTAFLEIVIPAKAGISKSQKDSGFRRSDECRGDWLVRLGFRGAVGFCLFRLDVAHHLDAVEEIDGGFELHILGLVLGHIG